MKKLLNLVLKQIFKQQENFGKRPFDKSKTIFCDMDGVLCYWKNEKYNKDEVLIMENVNFLKELIKENNIKIVLTTARSKKKCKQVLRLLKHQELKVSKYIFDLGVGQRLVINDKKSTGLNSAFSLNTDRNKNFAELFKDHIEGSDFLVKLD